jgi:hypothetical protein
MRLGLGLVLCVISAAIGAGIDHYWDDAVLLLRPKPSETVEATKPSASEEKNVEVLGDRVRCDVRFGELHLPESEYRSFFDKCMGSAAPSD